MTPVRPLVLKSLREQVYEYLREAMNRGELAPGSSVNLNELCERLEISKTPLRFALLQLESEGFVTILPRRGCIVNELSLEEIRNIYQIIGALEGSVILAEFHKITSQVITTMKHNNQLARKGLDEDDFNRFYEHNIKMHNCYIDLSNNARLQRTITILKNRLYDFPRMKTYIKEWEVRSTGEHEQLIHLMEVGDARGAAEYVRDVHWSYEVQKRFIQQYYMEAQETIRTAH